MERELWTVLAAAIAAVNADFLDLLRYTHPTFQIVRVHLWAALHDRCVHWATLPVNWPPCTRERRHGVLPDQSTMSRRTRNRPGKRFHKFLDALARRLSTSSDPRLLELKILDGKPLIVAAHSKDRHAKFGRGAGGLYKGYKLHALWGSGTLPDAWMITPMNVDERAVAPRLLSKLDGQGYVLADSHYDSNVLYGTAAIHGYQLIAPRDAPGSGLGRRKQRPGRLRSIALLERRMFGLGNFGPALFKQRRDIERRFGNLTSGVAGLSLALPPFVRKLWRVRSWVTSKLLIYAARCIRNAKHLPNAA